MQLVVFVGLQATGKSAFYHERFRDTHIRLNLDMLGTRRRERLLFEACLAAKQPVVIDNTNLRRVDRARYIGPARAAGFQVVSYYFESEIADALRRNAARPEPLRVPEGGMWGARGRLEPPAREEGFDLIFVVRLIEATRAFEVRERRDDDPTISGRP